MKKTFCLIITLVLVFGTFQNCQKEDSKPQTFIDLKVEEKKEVLSQDDNAKLKEAIARLDKKIQISNGSYDLSVTSGAEVGISEELFNCLKKSLDNTNQLIKEKKLVLMKNGVLGINTMKKPIRTKSADPDDAGSTSSTNLSGSAPDGTQVQATVETHWWGYQVTMDDHNSQVFLNNGATANAVVALVSTYIPVLGQAMTLVSGANALYYNWLVNDYNINGGGQGITFTQYFPGTFLSYSSISYRNGAH